MEDLIPIISITVMTIWAIWFSWRCITGLVEQFEDDNK